MTPKEILERETLNKNKRMSEYERLQREGNPIPAQPNLDFNRSINMNEHNVFQYLKCRMPSIGFCSTRKRISAFIVVMEHAQRLLDNFEADEETIYKGISLLRDHCKPFEKAFCATALMAPRFSHYDIVSLAPPQDPDGVWIAHILIESVCHNSGLPGFK